MNKRYVLEFESSNENNDAEFGQIADESPKMMNFHRG
jgi:hypothetical protein